MLLKSADTVYFAVMTCIIYMHIYIKQKTNKLYIKKIIKFTHQEDRNKKMGFRWFIYSVCKNKTFALKKIIQYYIIVKFETCI